MSPLEKLTHLFHRHDGGRGSDMGGVATTVVERHGTPDISPVEPPVSRYVQRIFQWLVRWGGCGEAVTFSPDDPLPAVDADSGRLLKEHPDEIVYRRVLNRLKVVSGLNPWPADHAESGVVEIVLDDTPCTFRVTILPHDSGVTVGRVFEDDDDRAGVRRKPLPEHGRISPAAAFLLREDTDADETSSGTDR